MTPERWQRVKASRAYRASAAGREQRFLLEMEGVRFRGKRVDMEAHQYAFRAPR